MNFKANGLAMLVAMLLNTVPAASSSTSDIPQNLVFSFNLGPMWTQAGRTQTFFIQPGREQSYVASNKSKVILGGELFVGKQGVVHADVLGQLGLAIAATTSAKLNGDIWVDADPEFDNFSYHYNINHSRLALKGKLVFERWQFLNPYLSTSLGIGFNRSHNFSISPKICEEIPGYPFGANNTTSFSYTLGIGLQNKMDTNWQFGLGYEFADWGHSQLNKALGQTLNSGLSLSHFYTNQLQFSINYLT